jgi:hypothetical protein
MSGLQSEFATKLALRPAVSLAKGMRSVQFAEKVGGVAGRGFGIEIGETVFSRQFRQDLLEGWFQEISEPKKVTAL